MWLEYTLIFMDSNIHVVFAFWGFFISVTKNFLSNLFICLLLFVVYVTRIAVFRNMLIQGTEYAKLQKRNFQGFPGGSAVKNPPTNAGDIDIGSISWSGRSPGGRNGNLPWYSCLGSPMDREAGHYSPMGSQRVGHNLATKQQEQNSFLNAFLKSVCIRILCAQIHWNHPFELQRFSCCQIQMLFSTYYSILIIWHCFTLFFLKGFFSWFPGITAPWFFPFHTYHSFSGVGVNNIIAFLLLLLLFKK